MRYERIDKGAVEAMQYHSSEAGSIAVWLYKLNPRLSLHLGGEQVQILIGDYRSIGGLSRLFSIHNGHWLVWNEQLSIMTDEEFREVYV